MQEYKVGEKIILEVQECDTCEGCFFNNEETCYFPTALVCGDRKDEKSIIFVEKKGNKDGE